MTVLVTIAALALSERPVRANHAATSPLISATKAAASRLENRMRQSAAAGAAVAEGVAVAVMSRSLVRCVDDYGRGDLVAVRTEPSIVPSGVVGGQEEPPGGRPSACKLGGWQGGGKLWV